MSKTNTDILLGLFTRTSSHTRGKSPPTSIRDPIDRWEVRQLPKLQPKLTAIPIHSQTIEARKRNDDDDKGHLK
jgi:hypothetical protein